MSRPSCSGGTAARKTSVRWSCDTGSQRSPANGGANPASATVIGSGKSSATNIRLAMAAI